MHLQHVWAILRSLTEQLVLGLYGLLKGSIFPNSQNLASFLD